MQKTGWQSSKIDLKCFKLFRKTETKDYCNNVLISNAKNNVKNVLNKFIDTYEITVRLSPSRSLGGRIITDVN